MSATIFCCSSVSPYRPRVLEHEAKFTAFMRWARLRKPSPPLDDGSASIVNSAPFAIQLVRQINYGPQESIRYFVPASDGSNFVEATEDDLVKSNFEKLNTYKNFRCDTHNRFFEVNLYQKNPTNAHHWRSNLARPSRDIDLAFRRQNEGSTGAPATGRGESVDNKTNTAFQNLLGSILPALEEAQGTAPKEQEHSSRPDITTLKRILRFLLPAVGQKLGSSSLISLLCLDRVSAELDLGLEFESLWETELTSSNILLFFTDCFAVGDLAVPLAEVEELVIPAMRYVDTRKAELPTGRARLHEIVKMVLESGHALNWVSVYGDGILHVFTSGPSEALLEHCRRKDDIPQQNRPIVGVGGLCGAESEKADKELWWRDDDNDFDYRYDDDSDHGATKDYTACDKECGYCGTCDY